MTDLRAISSKDDRIEAHVLFVHGLAGHIEATWTTESSSSQALWPHWLEQDIPSIKIWLVGFPAAMTHWGGYGISIPDRADSILARLLAESHLATGNVIFVAHSLGGLVVEQVLRTAERQAQDDERAKDFLCRVRRVAFLGTPHKGTILATLSKALWPVIRPTAVTRELILGGTELRHLNYWYRKHCRESGIENLLLAEGRAPKIFGISLPNTIGKIVSVNSADAGLPETPLIVDEDHKGISKPVSRSAEVYVHVEQFISRPFSAPLKISLTGEAIERNTKQLEKLSARTEEQSTALGSLTRAILDRSVMSESSAAIIDEEVTRRLEHIRKCRFFRESEPINHTRNLIVAIEEGDLSSASEQTKGTTLAWCARFLSGDHTDEAAFISDHITSGNSEIRKIAQGVITASSGRLQEAISNLCSIGTALAYGAAFIQTLRAKGFEEACNWMQKTGIGLTDLDSDAKFVYIRKALEDGCWDIALEAVDELNNSDEERTPGVIVVSADAYLLQAVPDELRMSVFLQEVPFNAAKFPLRSGPRELELRRKAMHLYGRFYVAAGSLGLSGLAALAEDKELWLRLVDPESSGEAKGQLVESINDPAKFLRRIGLGLQFGLDIDLEWAEQEVERQTALSGGMSHDAAYARLALALSKDNHESVAAYIGEHREQLLQHLDWKGVYFIEIEMLANAGLISKAEERLGEAIKKGLSEREAGRLRRELAEATGDSPIEARLAAYEESNSLVELRLLVIAYEEAGEWASACEYGQTLLEISGDISDARRQVMSLYRCGRLEEVLLVMEKYPALWSRDPAMRLLRAQSFFENGQLNDALDGVKELRRIEDSPQARQLQVNLAVVSGDWDSLQGFVEEEWNARTERTPIELLRAGKMAHDIGAGRVVELVKEAAERGSDDPNVLAGCYHLATEAGWESSSEVHDWMQKAVSLSDAEGPVQAVSLEDLFARKPDWERREASAWEMLEKGDVPLFAAGQLLNRSLLSLYLMPALGNLDEADVRRRGMIYAYSGARGKCKVNPNVVAMDATALVTAEFLGLLGVCIETFKNVVIPHGTLMWLLGERARVAFHQPSRVVAARALRRMIAEGHLYAFDKNTMPTEKLLNDVGPSLAALIAEASSTKHEDGRQRLVVRGGPVYKANSLMKEEADLGEYQSFLCSGLSVVRRLVHEGILTRREEEEAYAALAVREIPWPSEPEICDGAILYLDDLAISHLQFLGLLGKLYRADLAAYVSRSELEEADALISYDAIASNVISIVDSLRNRLREGLAAGKVLLTAASRGEEQSEPEQISAHPTMDLLKHIASADIGVVDDRAINQHSSISSETDARPLLTTVDLLDVLVERGVVSEERRRDALCILRRANFALTPISGEELNSLIEYSTVTDGVLEESGELRAIRESIQRLRMTNVLQAPKELAWLNGLSQACLFALKQQWREGLDEEMVVARSDWLLTLFDVRGWTHRLDDSVVELQERYRSWILVLMMLCTGKPQSIKEAYWRWFDSRLVESLREHDPDTYYYLVEWAMKHVFESVELCEADLKSRGYT